MTPLTLPPWFFYERIDGARDQRRQPMPTIPPTRKPPRTKVRFT